LIHGVEKSIGGIIISAAVPPVGVINDSIYPGLTSTRQAICNIHFVRRIEPDRNALSQRRSQHFNKNLGNARVRRGMLKLTVRAKPLIGRYGKFGRDVFVGPAQHRCHAHAGI